MSHLTRPRCIFALIAASIVFALTAPARATVLTFDVFTDAAKTTYYGNGNLGLQSYGDNVTDFSPAGILDGHYYNYGSAGGFTPDVTVEYRYYHPTIPADDGLTTVTYYSSQTGDNFGDLPHVFYSAQPVPYLVEIRFIPANGKTVVLESFDLAGYLTSKTVPTIAVVRNINTVSEVTLYGPLTNTVISGAAGTHTHFTPLVYTDTGQTLSLIFGADSGGVRGISNVTFFQVPEPATIGVLLAGAVLTLARRRRA